jgi:hypothetical protein
MRTSRDIYIYIYIKLKTWDLSFLTRKLQETRYLLCKRYVKEQGRISEAEETAEYPNVTLHLKY